MDATVGAGGHAWGILTGSAPDGRLIGFDLDEQALELAARSLKEFEGRVTLVHASFTDLAEQLSISGWPGVDGIVFDLGVSSIQLDQPERGFSIKGDGPLDMRFDRTASQTAAQLVNELSEHELADLLYHFGEERRARQVARAIVRARPLHSTRALADLVSQATASGRPGMHPATRSFQALRIAVNRELENLEVVLPQAVQALRPGGRLAMIAFHSLEDRIVKRFYRQESQDCICPPDQPTCVCAHQASLKVITRRPIRAKSSEIAANPRARSARLRVAERLD